MSAGVVDYSDRRQRCSGEGVDVNDMYRIATGYKQMIVNKANTRRKR